MTIIINNYLEESYFICQKIISPSKFGNDSNITIQYFISNSPWLQFTPAFNKAKSLSLKEANKIYNYIIKYHTEPNLTNVSLSDKKPRIKQIFPKYIKPYQNIEIHTETVVFILSLIPHLKENIIK